MNSVKIVLSQSKETYMLIYGLYIHKRGKYKIYYAQKATMNLLHAYKDAHNKILIDEYTGYVVQSISIFQSQCANMNFSDQSRYNRLFQQVVKKGGVSNQLYQNIF